ncbi:MAG: 3'-5' exonuclease [Candidatus Riflebacteria bacterium]|nr:3'-5' exonuclease [Candidatus Riflebacteria bacterium]
MPDFVTLPLKELPFVILDLETTGFKPVESGITEVAIISMINGKEEVFETLVNPERPIPAEITEITGINDAMVAGKPTISELAPILDEILKGSIFVSHNVPFDWSFLDFYFRKHLRKPLCMPSLCTLRLARKFLGLRSNKLSSVAEYFKIELKNAHRAMNDTRAVKEILFGFIDQLEKHGIKTGNDLYKNNLIFPDYPPTR